MRQIAADVLPALALGATILGTGGGGDPYIGQLMAEAAIRRYGPVQLLDVTELPAEGLVIPAAMMGAPTVMVEKIPNGHEIGIAVQSLEKVLRQRAVAIMSGEAGGINSLIPVAVAAQLGLPMVDADSMGRAFPELQMTSFALHGIKSTPMVLVDEKGNSILLDTIDNPWTERLARNSTVVMGGSAMLAFYPMTTSQARAASVPGTLGKAIAIGQSLQKKGVEADEKLRDLQQLTGGRIIFRGKVVDVWRHSQDGFARGTVTVVGLADRAPETLRVEFQNEHLIALINGVPVAMVPDLITILDQETLTAITTEGLSYGQRVAVMVMPCDPVWRTPAGLALVGPRYFGYDIDYLPFPVGERLI